MVARDKRDRRVSLRDFDRQRFEQEVAEEIGTSLDRLTGAAGLRRRRQATPKTPGGPRPGGKGPGGVDE